MAGVKFQVDPKKGSFGKIAGNQAKDTEGIVKSVLEGMGIGTGMNLIKSILNNFRSLLEMIRNLTKMISLILSPVTDVIMTLLYPVLLILKPIAMAVNQIMLPFLQQAMAFIKEGIAENNSEKVLAGTATIIAGLKAIILYLLGGLIKLISLLFWTVFAEVIGIFSDSAQNFIITNIIPALNGMIDTTIASGMTLLAMKVVDMGSSVGMDMTTFSNNFTGMIDRVFGSLSDKFVKSIAETLKITETMGLIPGFTSLARATGNEWARFAGDASGAIKGAFDSMISALGVNVPEVNIPNEPSNTHSFFERSIDWLSHHKYLIPATPPGMLVRSIL